MRTNMAGVGRYKLIRRLHEAEGYEAYSALDIEVSTRPQVLLNIYFGPDAVRQMVPMFYGMDSEVCPDFVRVYTEDGRFTAVFALHEGEPFEDVFPQRGGSLSAEERETFAESLLHGALECASMPARLLSAVLQPENVAVQRKNNRVCINCILPPVAGEEKGQGGGVPGALSPMLERVLRRPWRATDEQIDFLDRAADGGYASVSALYSAWRELLPKMEEDRKRGRLLEMLIRFLRRSFRRWRKRRKEERARKKRLREEAL